MRRPTIPSWREALPLAALLVTLALIAACGPALDLDSVNNPSGPTLDPDSELEPGPDGTLVPSYRIYVGASEDDPGSEAYPPDDNGSEAIWSVDARTVTLGTEEEGEPLALLIIRFESEPVATPTGTIARVEFAALSTTDVRVGTAEQLNARYYELEDGECGPASGSIVAVRYISSGMVVADGMCLKMRRVIVSPVAPTEYGETVYVTGEFVAMDP